LAQREIKIKDFWVCIRTGRVDKFYVKKVYIFFG